jgi:hypothetical protein
MSLLLAITALWSALLLLVIALCLAARQGDRQQSQASPGLDFEPYLAAPAGAGARSLVLRGRVGAELQAGRDVRAVRQASAG